MIRQTTRRFWLLLYAIAAALVLTGCGGGGGGSSSPSEPEETSTVSGTAAAGAPIVGFVGARDASGETKTVNIGADGSFELDVSGLNPPVLMFASGISGGNAYQLLSVAFADEINSTVNVTPLTDLVVGNAVGRSPVEFFNNPDFSQISQTAIEEQETALKTRLKPLLDGLGIDDNFDLRNTPFVANRSGFDAALDVISVSVDSGTNTATITNRIEPTKSITNNFTQPDTETTAIEVDEATLTSGVTTLQAVNTLVSNVATALENQDRTTLEAALAADFLNNGESSAEFLDRLLGSAPGIEDAGELAEELRNWSLVGQEAGLANINIGSPNGTWQAVDDNGVWKLAGNQLQFFATAEATHSVKNGEQQVEAIGVSLLAYNQVDALGTVDTSTVSVTGPQGTPFNTDLTAQTDLFSTFFVLDSTNLGQIETGDQYTFTWTNTSDGASADVPFTVRRGSPQLTEGAPLITSSTADLAADQYTFEWTLPPGYDSVSVRNNFTGQVTGGQGGGFTGNPLDNDAREFTGNLPEGFVPSADDELRLIARDPFGVFVAARLENPFSDQIPPPAAEDALIGSWIARNPDRTDNAPWVQLTFLESGYYMHQELDLPYRPEADDAGNTGLEFGSYEWDNQTGEVTVPEILIDDNGFWGLTDVQNGEERLALVVDGDTLTAYDPTVGPGESIQFTRVPVNQSGITGSWIVQDSVDPTNVSVLTILEDDFYFLGTTQPADATGSPGLEFGTFTYDSETLVLEPTALVDQNGEFGLSDPIQGFDYATVIDDFLIIDDGEQFQLSEIASGTPPSDGTVTVNYVSPDNETVPGPAVTGDFHYLRSGVGIESSRLNNPPSVFQAHYAHVDTNIVDNSDGTGTLSWTDLCVGDLLVDAGASEDGRDAIFDSVSECFGLGGSFDLDFTESGLFAAIPQNNYTDPEDNSQIIEGATNIDFRALDAGRSLFIANEVNTFQYEESGSSFTDGRNMNTHVLSRKDPSLSVDALAGDWGFVSLRISDISDDTGTVVPNEMEYGAGALNITVDPAGSATLTDEVQLQVVQGLKPLERTGIIIDPRIEETGISDSLGAFSLATDGTLSLLNGELGGFASQGADVITMALPNPFTPYTVQTNESSWLTGVKLDPNFQAADLAGKSYDVILKGYFAGENYFETDIFLPGATLDFDGNGLATSQRGLTFAFSNFGLNTEVSDTTRESAGLDPNNWTYQVDASTGLIRMESPQYTYSGGGTGFGEQVGYSSADNRLLVLVSRFYDDSTGTPTGPGGTYIAYAICNNCN